MKLFEKVKRPTMEETVTALYVTIIRDLLTIIDARLAGRQVEIKDSGSLIITTIPPDWTPESEQEDVENTGSDKTLDEIRAENRQRAKR